MKISKIIYVVIFSWFLGIFSTASAGELCTECLKKVPQEMRDYVYNMDFMDAGSTSWTSGYERLEE